MKNIKDIKLFLGSIRIVNTELFNTLDIKLTRELNKLLEPYTNKSISFIGSFLSISSINLLCLFGIDFVRYIK